MDIYGQTIFEFNIDDEKNPTYSLYEAWRTGFDRELSVRELNFKLVQGQCFFDSFQYFFFEDSSSSIFNFYSHQASQSQNDQRHILK